MEDNDDIREYISASLEDYRVILAKNGKEGWEKTQKEIPDVVISDVIMPVMDGFELCRLIKKRYAYQSHSSYIIDSKGFYSR